MTEISITLANGRSVSFPIRGSWSESASEPPCFLLSMRKCGSSITNNMCRALAMANGRPFVEVGHTFFSQNLPEVEWCRDPALRQLIRPGLIYGGFRNLPRGLLDDPAFIGAPKLLLIRDPRDALVSEYFSNAYSHPIPKGAEGADGVTRMMEAQRAQALAADIREVVKRRAKGMARDFEAYAPLLPLPNVLVLKYEDMIFRKADLIRHLARHFGMVASEQMVADILGWADKTPEEEDPRNFVRQVSPGDHRRKLDRETITHLNQMLAHAMAQFGYAP